MASPWGDVWSPQAERVVSRLLANLPSDQPSETLSDAARLRAIPIGWSLWAHYLLRVDGDVIVLNEDEDDPERITIHEEPGLVLAMLVSGSERYPELKQFLPVRGPNSVDCPCMAHPVFATRKVFCRECGGLGWLPAVDTQSPQR